MLLAILALTVEDTFTSRRNFASGWRLTPLDHDRVPISLNSGTTTLTRDSGPSPGQRFEIAYTTGYAIMEWFFVDWVHKSISSHKVYFFRTIREEWNFSSAYLGGFEDARPAQENSNKAFSHVDFQTNVYRRPARHGGVQKNPRYLCVWCFTPGD